MHILKKLICTSKPTNRLFNENLVSRIHILGLIKQTLDSDVFVSVSSLNSNLEITVYFQSNMYYALNKKYWNQQDVKSYTLLLKKIKSLTS